MWCICFRLSSVTSGKPKPCWTFSRKYPVGRRTLSYNNQSDWLCQSSLTGWWSGAIVQKWNFHDIFVCWFMCEERNFHHFFENDAFARNYRIINSWEMWKYIWRRRWRQESFWIFVFHFKKPVSIGTTMSFYSAGDKLPSFCSLGQRRSRSSCLISQVWRSVLKEMSVEESCTRSQNVNNAKKKKLWNSERSGCRG